MKSDFIWMDGKFVPYEQATVHLINPTIHYGIGVFEGIRCYATDQGPAIFRLRDHLIRFLESIHILGIRDFPYSLDALEKAVGETVLINGFNECYIRPLMYMEGPMGLNMVGAKSGYSRLGMGSIPRYRGERNWHSYDGIIVHSPAS